MRRLLLSTLAGLVLPLQALAVQATPDLTRATVTFQDAVVAASAASGERPTARGRTAARPAIVPPADQGFLFGPPAASIGIWGGLSMARAGSNIYDVLTDTLTNDRGDFDALALSLELAIRFTPRIDGVLRLGRTAVNTRSEYRNWVDQDDASIEQTTRIQRVPVTAGAKVYLTSRGRQVGEFAWIPNKLAFYVGGGGGFLHYRFEQEGDFIDFRNDFSIGEDATFESSGWTPTAYGAVGAELRLTTAAFLSLEARGGWAAAELGRDFGDFDPIDLSGLQLVLGLHRSL